MTCLLTHVFVDFDGTVTNVDTFDVLVRHFAGPERWAELETRLHDGTMTLREVLAAQAHFVQGSVDEADALLDQAAHVDATFPHFVARCEQARIPLTIVSSGIAPLIERALARYDLSVNVLANELEITPGGWVMQFRDSSANGHDKAAAVLRARERGAVAYAGDGYSDFDAALAADYRFAKRGRSLERYLMEKGVPFTPFSSFTEVEAALF